MCNAWQCVTCCWSPFLVAQVCIEPHQILALFVGHTPSTHHLPAHFSASGTHSQEGVLHTLQNPVLCHGVSDLVFGHNDVFLQDLHCIELVGLFVTTQDHLAKGPLPQDLLHLKVFNSLCRSMNRGRIIVCVRVCVCVCVCVCV